MVVVNPSQPATAEALMRSRFEAFQRGDADWLLDTWDPETRPRAVDLTDNPAWLALTIVDTSGGGPLDDTGTVEFEATYLADGSPGVLRERSHFRRIGGRWFYVDGDVT